MTEPNEGSHDDWEALWDDRLAALESVLGPVEDKVYHAMVPFTIGGTADVVVFRDHVDGVVYVTADLIGDEDSKPNAMGQYELMICVSEEDEWACSLLSNLATYTREAVLSPYDTMSIGGALPQPTEIVAFVYLPYATLDVGGRKAGLLLCLGITQSEFDYIQENDIEDLVEALGQAGIFPRTDLKRSSMKLA